MEPGHCRFCDRHHISVWYCKSCEEGLCEDCNITHGRIRALTNHDVLPLKGAEITRTRDSSANSKRTVFEKCENHDKDAKRYCMNCKHVVCNDCIDSDHQDHTNVLISMLVTEELEEISSRLSKLKKKIMSFDCTLKQLQNNVEIYSDGINQLKTNILSRGCALKLLVDKIVNEIISDLQLISEADVREIGNKSKEVEDNTRQVEELVQTLEKENVETYSVKQLLECSTSMRERTNNIPDVPELPKWSCPTLSCPIKFDKIVIRNMIGNVKRTEKIIHPCKSRIKQNYSSDLSSADSPLALVTSSFKLPKQAYRVCIVDADSALVLEKYPHTELFKVNRYGQIMDTVISPALVYDVAVVDNEVFVTAGNSLQKITMSGCFETIIQFSPFYAKGLGVAEHDILVCLYRPGSSRVTRMTTAGDTVQTIQKFQDANLFKKPQYVTYNKSSKHIYVIDDNKILVVIDENEKLKFQYSEPVGMSLEKAVHFYGIACDSFGNIFISDRDNGAIHHLDESGHFLNLLKLQNDKIIEPTGICAGTISSELWLCNGNGEKVVVIKYTFV